MCPSLGGFQQSWVLIWTPSSEALITRIPQKGHPIYGNSHINRLLQYLGLPRSGVSQTLAVAARSAYSSPNKLEYGFKVMYAGVPSIANTAVLSCSIGRVGALLP